TVRGTDSAGRPSFSPHGKTLIVTSGDWHAPPHLVGAPYEGVQDAGDGDPPPSLWYGAGGKALGSGTYDPPTPIWDATTGKELRKLGSKEFGLISNALRKVKSMALAPDGKQVAYSTYGKRSKEQAPEELAVALVSSETGKFVRQFMGVESSGGSDL